MSDIEKALVELKPLMTFRAERLGHQEEFRALGLTSRNNLCNHPSVYLLRQPIRELRVNLVIYNYL